MNSLERFRLQYEYQEEKRGQQLWRVWGSWLRRTFETTLGKWV